MFYRQRGEEDKDIRKVLAGIVMLIAAMIVFCIPGLFQSVSEDMIETIKAAVYILIYLGTVHDVVIHSITNIFNGKIEVESLLITIASLGAFFVGTYWEACTVMFVFMLCENFEERIGGNEAKGSVEIRGINLIKIFTTTVVAFAVVIAVVPPMVDVFVYGAYIKDFHEVWSQWIYRALTCLAIGCPCTLLIAENISYLKIKQNVVIGLIMKCAILILAAVGILTIWMTAFAELIICAVIVANAKKVKK